MGTTLSRLLLFAVSLLMLPAASAQSFRVSLRPDARFEVQRDGVSRLRTALRADLAWHANDQLSVHAFLATGGTFRSRWYNAYNFRTEAFNNQVPELPLRHAFVRWQGDLWRVEAGAIPPVKATASPTGLDPVGWVDGVRVVRSATADEGLEVVVGRLGSIGTPSAVYRPWPFLNPDLVNYAEMEYTRRVAPDVRVEGSVEYLQDPYVRSEVRADFDYQAVVVEAMANLNTEALSYGALWEIEPLNRTTFAVQHAYRGEQIGLRGELSDDFVAFGHVLSLSVARVFIPAYGFRVRVRTHTFEGADGDLAHRLEVEAGARFRW